MPPSDLPRTLAIGSDHGGLVLKNAVAAHLKAAGFEVEDVGTHTMDSVDYPDFAEMVSERVLDGRADAGILVCTTGIGVSIAANRHAGIQASLVHDVETAKITREHNASNVLCLAGKTTPESLAKDIATAWLAMLLMRVLVGIGEAAYGPTAPTLISDLFPVQRRGAVLAWFYAAIPVGSALGFVMGGLVTKYTTWHWAFLLTLPPGLALGAMCFLMKDPPRGISDGATHHRAGLRDYATLARTPSYVLAVAGMTAFTFAIGGISFWMPTFLHEHRGQTDLGHVNLMFGGITVVAGLSATLIGGWLGDRLRARYSGSYFLVSGVGMLVGFPFFLASLYAPMPMAYGFIFIAIFFLFLSTGPSNAILANVTHPSIRATGFALSIFFIHAFGDAISPPVIGWVTDLTKSPSNPAGDMTLGFLIVGAMILLSGALWIWGAAFLKRDTELAPTRFASNPRSTT